MPMREGDDAATVELADDSEAVERTRIKQILEHRANYINTRSEARTLEETGRMRHRSAVESIKSKLDSFLLDIRPVVLDSEHADVWHSAHVATVELPEHTTRRTNTPPPHTDCIIPEERIEIHGLSDLLALDVTRKRQYHIKRSKQRTRPDERSYRLGDAIDEYEASVVDVDVLDTGFSRANDVLSQVGLDLGLSDADEIADFDYSDLI